MGFSDEHLELGQNVDVKKYLGAKPPEILGGPGGEAPRENFAFFGEKN